MSDDITLDKQRTRDVLLKASKFSIENYLGSTEASPEDEEVQLFMTVRWSQRASSDAMQAVVAGLCGKKFIRRV